MNRHWLNWCRLCANDYAVIDVRNKDVYMKIISKVFDVEIGLEEPALGAMLCKECYSLIGDLLYFIDNVNKVQPIFELLRHTEPGEQLDVEALRKQYGLPTNFQNGHSEAEISNANEEIMEVDVKHFLLDDDTDEDELKNSIAPTPAKRKRGRPRKSEYVEKSIKGSVLKGREDIDMELEPVNSYEELDHIWLDDEEEETLKTVKIEKLECDVSYEDLDVLYNTKSELDELQTSEQEEEIQMPIKRKRGRPRKDEVSIKVKEPLNNSPSKNYALERLLASPQHENPVRVSCKICKKDFQSEANLRQHKDRVHIKKKTIVCDCCGKRFSSSSELKEHMLVHTDERPFACPLCNARFKNKKRLNVHSQTHGKPKFECEICGKKLQTRAIWNKHKYVHSDERRFTCSICGTGHKHSTGLKVHLLSHAGFRPYACKYCNKAFASSTNCKDHKMKKHAEEYAKDDDKSSRIQSVPTLDELRALAESMEKGERLRKPRSVEK